MTPEDAVVELASLSGIEPSYYDIFGNLHVTPVETKKAVLASMGLADIEGELKRLRLGPWLTLIEPVMVVSADSQPDAIAVRFPLNEGLENDVVLRWSITDEEGNRFERKFCGIVASKSVVIDGSRHVEAALPNETGRKIGYYDIALKCETGEASLEGSMLLIVAPESCHVPPERTWGVSLNLYSLRSQGNWGVGDFGDLGEFIEMLSGEGGGFVGLNPLHAITNHAPYGISPYYPLSRLYRNFIYLDMKQAASSSPAMRKTIRSRSFAAKIEAMRNAPLIDYDGVSALKEKALRRAFSSFDMDSPEGGDFKLYVLREGKALRDFATFMALAGHLGSYRWRDWPEGYRSPEGTDVEEFRKANKKEVLFQKYLQWLIDKQLEALRLRAGKMPVGIYCDLAVGSSGDGSDSWSHQGLFAAGASTGAPPDSFNPKGQNWGLPPLIPERLRQLRYEPFISVIRKNLRHAGALRVDHAMGLFRLFWIPDGMPPSEGAYVRYPYEDLLRIIALESKRHGAAIIAEDLGTVTDEAREAMGRFGMLSTRLFYFERNWDTMAFLPPEAYPELALTAVTTHDLPTIRGFWEGRDMEVKKSLGIYQDGEAMEKDAQDRERDRRLMLDALRASVTEAEEGGEARSELVISVYEYLARTPSRLLSIYLDDIMGTPDQQNMPGTVDGHPNWRQKTPSALSEMLTTPRFKALCQMLRGKSLRAMC